MIRIVAQIERISIGGGCSAHFFQILVQFFISVYRIPNQFDRFSWVFSSSVQYF